MARYVVKDGDVFRIDLETREHAYAQRIKNPLFAFFAPPDEDDGSAECAISGRHLFSIWVMKHAPRDGGWTKLGNLPVAPDLAERIWFRKQDFISGEITKYASGGEERPATFEEARFLEPATVWDDGHIADRLVANLAGQKSEWEMSLELKPENSVK